MPDEYISRAEALRAVQKQRGANRSPAQNAMLDRICCDIKNRPAADVAEVVRCKDCKHKVQTDANGIVICSEEHGMYCPTESDFCRYGEYRTNTGGVTE